MANQLDANVKDDLKTQFVTREGTYRLLTLSEYSRPNRVGYSNNQSSPQVRVSFVTLPNPSAGSGSHNSKNNSETTASPATTITTSDKRNPLQSNGAKTTATSTTTTPTTATTTTTIGTAAAISASTALNGGGAGGDTIYNGTSTVDARLGGGISMHSMTNGAVLDQNGMPTNQIYGGDRICFNFGRDLYVYAFRGIKKVRKQF